MDQLPTLENQDINGNQQKSVQVLKQQNFKNIKNLQNFMKQVYRKSESNNIEDGQTFCSPTIANQDFSFRNQKISSGVRQQKLSELKNEKQISNSNINNQDLMLSQKDLLNQQYTQNIQIQEEKSNNYSSLAENNSNLQLIRKSNLLSPSVQENNKYRELGDPEIEIQGQTIEGFLYSRPKMQSNSPRTQQKQQHEGDDGQIQSTNEKENNNNKQNINISMNSKKQSKNDINLKPVLKNGNSQDSDFKKNLYQQQMSSENPVKANIFKIKKDLQNLSIKQWGYIKEAQNILIYILINDLASNYQQKTSYQTQKSLINVFINQLSKIYINPIGKGKILWDLILTYINFTVLFCISIDTFFYPKEKLWRKSGNQAMITTALCFIVFDIIITFFTGYYEQGFLQKNFRQIAKSYLRKYFKWDIIALLGMLMVHTNSNWGSYFSWLVFFRFGSIFQNLQKLENFFFTQDRIKYIVYLFKLFVFLLIIVHFASCFFFGLGKFEIMYLNYGDDTWLEDYNSLEQNWLNQYLTSFFLMAALLMGEGVYILPHSELETGFYIIFILCTCISIAFIINAMGHVYNSINKEHEKYNQELTILNRFIKKKQLPLDLQMRSKNYLQYLYKQQEDITTEEESNLLIKMSQNLYDEIIKVTRKTIMDEITILNDNFSKEVISKITLQMEEFRYSYNEIINKSNICQNYLYYIYKGEAQITPIDYNDPGIVIKEKQVFGLYGFLTGQNLPYDSIKSTGFSIIYRINRQKVLSILQQYPIDQEKFFFLRDNFLQKQFLLDLPCDVCLQEKHVYTNCNKIHFIPEKQKIIQEESKNIDQNRQRYFRRELRWNSKLDLQKYKMCITQNQKQFINDYINKKLQLGIDLDKTEEEIYLYLQNICELEDSQSQSEMDSQYDDYYDEDDENEDEEDDDESNNSFNIQTQESQKILKSVQKISSCNANSNVNIQRNSITSQSKQQNTDYINNSSNIQTPINLFKDKDKQMVTSIQEILEDNLSSSRVQKQQISPQSKVSNSLNNKNYQKLNNKNKNISQSSFKDIKQQSQNELKFDNKLYSINNENKLEFSNHITKRRSIQKTKILDNYLQRKSPLGKIKQEEQGVIRSLKNIGFSNQQQPYMNTRHKFKKNTSINTNNKVINSHHNQKKKRTSKRNSIMQTIKRNNQYYGQQKNDYNSLQNSIQPILNSSKIRRQSINRQLDILGNRQQMKIHKTILQNQAFKSVKTSYNNLNISEYQQQQSQIQNNLLQQSQNLNFQLQNLGQQGNYQLQQHVIQQQQQNQQMQQQINNYQQRNSQFQQQQQNIITKSQISDNSNIFSKIEKNYESQDNEGVSDIKNHNNNNFYDIRDLDKMKLMKIYFVKGNYDTVLVKYNNFSLMKGYKGNKKKGKKPNGGLRNKQKSMFVKQNTNFSQNTQHSKKNYKNGNLLNKQHNYQSEFIHKTDYDGNNDDNSQTKIRGKHQSIIQSKFNKEI